MRADSTLCPTLQERQSVTDKAKQWSDFGPTEKNEILQRNMEEKSIKEAHADFAISPFQLVTVRSQ